MRKLHREDREIVYSFIDNVRLNKGRVDVNLEIDARYVAEDLGLNPDMPNGFLANRFARLFETNQIA